METTAARRIGQIYPRSRSRPKPVGGHDCSAWIFVTAVWVAGYRLLASFATRPPITGFP